MPANRSGPSARSGGRLAGRSRWQCVGAGIAVLVLGALFYLGNAGKRQALYEARLRELSWISDELQNRWRGQRKSSGHVPAVTFPHQRPPDPRFPENVRIEDLIRTLRTRVGQLETDYSSHRPPVSQTMDVRLAKAVLANVEQRYADVLKFLAGDETPSDPGQRSAPSIDESTRLLQIRADACVGLKQWREAGSIYKEIHDRDPERLDAFALGAESLYEVGDQEAAVATYTELARELARRARSLIVQGRLGPALALNEDSIRVFTWLVDAQGRSELTAELARCQESQGQALLLQGNSGAGIGD